mgnify:CR=1 FL=1
MSREVEEIIRYLSDNSILVITSQKLIRIYCPFNVKPLADFSSLKITGVYSVIRVTIIRDLQTVYIINEIAYNAKYFLLVI